MERERILFICTHNAARSQMAEGYLRARYGDQFEAFSAGTEVSTVSQDAVRVMKEMRFPFCPATILPHRSLSRLLFIHSDPGGNARR